MKFILPILFILILLVSGCTQQSGQEDLTTTISPARDLTGTWQTSAEWQNNVANPACSYEGDIVFNFQQTNNQLAGNWQATITNINQLIAAVPCGALGPQQLMALQGTVSSSSFQFTSGTIEFNSTYTTDLIKGTFESCSDQICNDGSRAVGAIGSFTGSRQ